MRTRAQYAAVKAKRKASLRQPPRLRNPSKNTVKRIMRRALAARYADGWQWNVGDENNYFFFNWVGARLYIMSKGRICNREPKGYERQCFRPYVRPDAMVWNLSALLEELRKHTSEEIGAHKFAPIGNIGDVIELPKPNWAWMFRIGVPVKQQGMNFAMCCFIP